MKKLISESLETKHLLGFHYQGFYRVVEPHTFGLYNNGNELLIAYQVKGASKTRNPPFWSNFLTEEIEDLVILDETFLEPRDGYKRGDKRFNQIYSEL